MGILFYLIYKFDPPNPEVKATVLFYVLWVFVPISNLFWFFVSFFSLLLVFCPPRDLPYSVS